MSKRVRGMYYSLGEGGRGGVRRLRKSFSYTSLRKLPFGNTRPLVQLRYLVSAIDPAENENRRNVELNPSSCEF